MTIRPLLTFADVVDHCKDFLESYSKAARLPVIRRAVLDAYQSVSTAHRWSFLERNGRIHLHARQTAGTVAYEQATRRVTLTDATWPDWAIDGSIRLGGNTGLVCDIQAVESSTTALLDPMMNPGRDLAAAAYVLYQRWAWLPSDFQAFTGPFAEQSWQMGLPVSLSELLAMDRYQSSSGEPLYYAIADVPDVYDRKALYFWPQMEADRTSDFVYRRRPRQLRYSGQEGAEFAGTITTIAGSPVVHGVGTAFDAGQVGSILRIGSSGNVLPTSAYGDAPFAEERSIVAVTNASTITLDSGASESRDGVRYVLTDPIDLGWVAHTAFLRECERQLGHLKAVDALARLEMESQRALLEAMAADNATWSDAVQEHPYSLLVDRPVTVNWD